jgi:hypothetical protein
MEFINILMEIKKGLWKILGRLFKLLKNSTNSISSNMLIFRSNLQNYALINNYMIMQLKR